MSKASQLQQLKEEILANKKLPLADTAINLVFDDGNPDSKIIFIGEAPGATEDETGKPFVGRAGKLLEQLLNEISIKREDVYITNTVKYRPPKNRDPKPEEIKAFLPYLDREIEIIEPEIIVTLGRFAMEKFLPDAKISQVHGTLQEVTWNNKKIKVFPVFHPSAALRFKKFKEELQKDLKTLASLI